MDYSTNSMSGFDFGSYGLIALIVSSTIVCYMCIKPIVHWFVKLKQDRILSYLMCSFIIFILTTLIGYSLFDLDLIFLIKMTLLCVALFGGFLVILQLLHFIYQSIFAKKT